MDIKNIFSKSGIIVSVSVLFFISAVGFALWSQGSPKKIQKGKGHAVIVTADGFSPAELTISQGDTIIFTTNTGKQFWPASDPHPTHTDYPEFDPQKPIDPTASWTFQFNKIGDWKYHDHLYFTHRAIVHVVASVYKPTVSDAAAECNSSTDNVPCWADQINQTLQSQGLDAAFDVMASLYNTNPSFAENCHAFAHTLGQDAYKKYAAHQDIELSVKASYCGYGFYHGFMESLLKDTGDVQQARDFCSYVGKKLSAQTTDAEGACYHGIGHGAVDGVDIGSWGNPQAMIAPGLKLCETVANTPAFLYRCTTGAFNALEILSNDDKYKLTTIRKDPFSLCPSQPGAYQEPCYTNMLPAYMRLYNNDLEKIAKVIDKIPEQNDAYTIRYQVMSSIFHEYVRLHIDQPNYDIAAGVKLCRSLSARAHDPCIEGLSGGHMKYGEPQNEYVKGLAFCASSLLNKQEAGICYQYILPRLRIWYTVEKSQQICSSVPEDYQTYCSHIQ